MSDSRAIGLLVGALLAASVLLPVEVSAHAFDPALLQLDEQPDGRVQVRWKVASSAAGLKPGLPSRCPTVGPPRSQQVGRATLSHWTIDCGVEGLAEAEIGVSGIRAGRSDVLVRVALADGRERTGVLRSDGERFVAASRTAAPSILPGRPAASVYIRLGWEHVLSGWDHLLFLVALLMLVSGWRALLGAVTAFTLAHSLTLALATLGLLSLPVAPVEAAISLSIVLLAGELLRGGPPTLSRRVPGLMAGVFGLVHGLGFAGALMSLGLPSPDRPLALLAFNLGVEAGQLAFIGAAVALGALVGERLRRARLRAAVAYGIGTVATFWTIQRVVGFWG